ncbi:DNA repair and recombination helicase PIF1 [Hyphodiscus hymeniophilus]|uniref:ATP-dependent DNA helicase n=1 Tax=Hyphodiscus hymeniophilus TaxID=353542 RepID=A0A9P6VJL1_9HELO|nr:DNA repair and recombination helicase PIF1 [Hyphodiscus hymeniophilus]
MGKRPKNVAYVVRRGRTPGIYLSWDECSEQVNGFSRPLYEGYSTQLQAQQVWEAWQQKEPAAVTTLKPADLHAEKLNESNDSQLGSEATAREIPAQPRGLKRCNFIIDLTTSDSDAENGPPTTKSSYTFVDLTGSGGGDQPPPAKKRKTDTEASEGGDSNPINAKLEAGIEVQQEAIRLTPAQEAVVQLAVGEHNIFLTGAAGSGKTATLKDILRRLTACYPPSRESTEESKFPSVQVVAPTGIAALPLDGKTTYSFAGWKTDSFQQPMEKLCENVSKRVRKAMMKVQVVIIEEISMVENQFLERLNLLMQYVLGNQRPFGGKQVIFVGDFHQLPPVKPFETCLACGETMTKQNVGPVCDHKTCPRRGKAFKMGDKWAFRAPVWSQLKMKHVKLEQIHRQHDTGFQDILNKIRNGILLSDEEWEALTAKKDTTFAVKLMSMRNHVISCNERCLNSIRAESKSWEALDSCQKLYYTDDDIALYSREIERKAAEHKETLKDHRLPKRLTLKVGAKVVLLSNTNPSGGLVNGSQGEVVKFVDTVAWPPQEPDSSRRKAEQEKINEFQRKRGHLCPVVRFRNGKIATIQPVAQESLRGPSNDKYVVCRAQIPLALAWALSIHKSQGMTLDNVEVSSDAIFESGQLYVGLSRATKLEGLKVTGYSREQLEMDEDVLDFYKNAPWEDLEPSNALW